MSKVDGPSMMTVFHPPWWLSGAHAQTLAGALWPQRLPRHRAVARRVELDDGDIVVVHDDCPEGWPCDGRIALLLHGLGGCHRSPLLVRLAAKLTERGVRVFRWDMRGCGAGVGLAGRPYHAGCSDDLRRVIESVLGWCSSNEPEARCRLTLFGVSLSGNIVLKYLGESPDSVPSQIVQAVVVNPPIDLAASVRTLDGRINRMYDRHFVGSLTRHLADRLRLRPDSPMPVVTKRPRTLYEFDDWYTAPLSGFSDADTYYAKCSAAQFVPQIGTPTTIITSRDDPMIPVEMFATDRVRYPQSVRLAIANGGGHVGYIACAGIDPDVHWLDWRVVELVTGS
ncbi:MAG: alpha/beta fold hydrolase [Planctomycetota bacterium]